MRFAELDRENKQWVTRFPVQEFYTVLQMGYLFHLSTPQIYIWIRQGKLRAVTIEEDGKDLIRIEHNEMVRFFEERRAKQGRRDIKPYIPANLEGLTEEAKAQLEAAGARSPVH